MAANTLSRSFTRAIVRSRPSHRVLAPALGACSPACVSRVHTQAANIPVLASSTSRHRPTLHPQHQPVRRGTQINGTTGSRSIFIQTETTPNADVKYLSPRSTLAAPYPSPLAAKLLNVDGVSAVFYGPDFITITKAGDANWAHIKPEVFSLITEAVTTGEPIVNAAEAGAGGSPPEEDSLSYNEDDDEVVGMIKELLETRIRPAIQEDGGDIEYRGFEDGIVSLKLRGACRTCDSSTVTLKNGIESMLMHYIEEVKGVNHVLDQEEEVGLHEFEKFEEKLRQQKGPQATASSSLDAVE
ncbi:hypothetical protein ACJ72_03497 [Emergomyces africanus]|uniref:Scaffold protein Nfu/NifU N-terminal domain-containing protein n=1 Tax=Emergomyces africanus TaxID=1955775 RepID=A0A1B7NZF5_9EURO|nr:hypothetical protein ACJ72_03497 [Emergomyces africanus]